MKGKLFITAAALVLGLGCGITASASPRVVSYGFVFDPQFYAETNPDVAWIWNLWKPDWRMTI